MTVNIRRFTEKDIDQILSLQDEWFESGILPSFVNRLYKENFLTKNTLVAENSNIVGYSLFSARQYNEFEIEYLYLSKSKRKMGLGERLLKHVESEIKDQGGEKIIISPASAVDLERLIAYYEKLGYTQEEDRLFAGNMHKIMSKTIHH